METEAQLVCQAWTEMPMLSVVDRLIVLSKMLNRKIYEIWPVVKDYGLELARSS